VPATSSGSTTCSCSRPAGIALALGWLVLRARRPDPLVGVAYVIVGLPLFFRWPIFIMTGRPWPT
jgi:hypothetical protein